MKNTNLKSILKSVTALTSAMTLASAAMAQDAPEYVNFSGSETIATQLMPILLSGFATENGAAEVNEEALGGLALVSDIVTDGGFGDSIAQFRVSGTISSDAFANLIGRSAQVGLSSRRIRPAEVAKLQDIGAGDMTDPQQEHIVALDNLVVVKHPNNAVDSLTMSQLRDIYAGKITNWSQLGGANAEINVVQHYAASATKSTFDELIFGGVASASPAKSVTVNDSAEVSATVYQDEHALGYVSAAYLDGTTPMPLVSDCGIEMAADPFSARTGEYALHRQHYMYTRADNRGPSPEAFIQYATSPAADKIVAKSGLIDLGISHREQALDSQRADMLRSVSGTRTETRTAERMLLDMSTFDRLSSTFRFETGSDRLTRRGEVDMLRLVEFVGELPAGTKLKVVGFTDSVGTFENNRALAERRAAQVLATLTRAAGSSIDNLEIDTAGYSEVAPVSCNSEVGGRANNRRVEVWIESGVL